MLVKLMEYQSEINLLKNDISSRDETISQMEVELEDQKEKKKI